MITAVQKGTFIDALIRIIALLGQAAPVFWLGIAAIYVFSVRLGWLPTSGYGEPVQYVLPVFSMSLFMIAAFLRLTRASMIESLESEYIINWPASKGCQKQRSSGNMPCATVSSPL